MSNLTAITVIQNISCAIYHTEIPEIDPDVVTNNLRLMLEGQPRRDETNAIHKGFHVTQTEVFTKETNHLFDDLILAIENKVKEILTLQSAHYRKGLANITPVVETYWGVLYKKGDRANWHNHEEIYAYQAVYYPDVADDAAPILFQHQDRMHNGPLEIKPNKGSLVIFNGRARHMVPEITSDRERLVFASNLIYKAR